MARLAQDAFRGLFKGAEHIVVMRSIGAFALVLATAISCHSLVLGLWALALFAIGSSIGFLFGIPRVLQRDGDSATWRERRNRVEAYESVGPEYQQRVNTNLEQISDWLTKMLVGVGLVELKACPGHVSYLAKYVTNDSPTENPWAAGVVVTFSALGFFFGYLATRLYLAGAFARADRQASANKQMAEMLLDVQSHIAGTLHTSAMAAGHVAASTQAAVKAVLWVDDVPANNSLFVDNIRSLGIEVIQESSTDAGLAKYSSRAFDVVITDMGRKEGLVFNAQAGLEFVRALRDRGARCPIIVFSSRSSQALRKDAISVGATAMTSSWVELRRYMGA